MATHYGKLSPARRRVLAAVMLGTLAAMVLAAWALQWRPARRIEAAVELLAEARRAPADRLWPAEPRIDWYLWRRAARVEGWAAAVRGRADDGRFLGADLDLHSLGQHRIVSMEHWSLNPTLTAGQYQGNAATPEGAVHMVITLTGGEIRTRGTVPRLIPEHRGEIEAPANYLPEGTLDLIARRVAAQPGADAQFQLIFDSEQRHPELVFFQALRFRSLPKAQGPDGKTVLRTRVTSVRAAEKMDQILEFDRDGILVRKILPNSGVQLERASLEEVLRYSPDAPQILRRNLQQHPPDPAWPLFLRTLQDLLTKLAGPADELSI